MNDGIIFTIIIDFFDGYGYTEDMKRLLLFVMALLICAAVTSCDENKITEVPKTEQNQANTVTEVVVDTNSMKKNAVDALNSINSVDLGGKNFTVASTSAMVYVPESKDTNYKVAIDERNRMFEKKCSAHLLQFNDNEDIMLRTARLNMLSGVYYTDLFSIPQKDLGKFAAQGILLRTSTLVGADFSKPWYDPAMMEQAAYSSENYGIYGDFNRDIANYYCLYVNRDLLTSAGLKMPYDKVKNGSWTWDELIAMLRANAEINGTAALSSSNMGLLTKAVYKSGGNNFVDTGKGKEPVLAFNNERTAGVMSLLRRMGGYKTLYNENAESGSAGSDFMQGKSLFYIGTVGEMKTITTMSFDWCILPLPKTIASNDTYYSYVSPDHAVIAVYAGSHCSDMTQVIDALYASSTGGYLSDAYYYELIDTAIRDSSALDMMDYICGIKGGKPVNDFTDIYTQYQPYAENAVAKAMYNYDLTPEAIYRSVVDGFEKNKNIN